MTPEQVAESTTIAYRRLLDPSDPLAAMIWADLARVCNVLTTSHAIGDSDRTAFNEGRRSVFLHIAARCGLPLFPGA